MLIIKQIALTIHFPICAIQPRNLTIRRKGLNANRLNYLR